MPQKIQITQVFEKDKLNKKKTYKNKIAIQCYLNIIVPIPCVVKISSKIE